MSAQQQLRYTLEEYLELDLKSSARLEFWNGEIFDMSGVDPKHDAVESNLHFALRARLQGRPCRVFLANIRIKVPGAPPYRYADLSALCGAPRYENIGGVDALTNPELLVEVLSDSTEAYDRGAKFTHYKSVQTFREYLLVLPGRVHITHLLRQKGDAWEHREYTAPEASVPLSCLGVEIPIREIYEGITLSSAVSPGLPPIERS